MYAAHSKADIGHTRLVLTVGEGLGNACRIYGLNPLYGRLYAALFLSSEPVSLPDLVSVLGVAKSTVSVSVRQLLAFGLVRRVNKAGDRRDYYAIVEDPLAVLTHILRNFVTREIAEGLAVAEALQTGLEGAHGDGWPDEQGMAVLRQRAQALTQMTHISHDVVSSLLRERGGITAAGLLATLAPLFAQSTKAQSIHAQSTGATAADAAIQPSAPDDSSNAGVKTASSKG